MKGFTLIEIIVVIIIIGILATLAVTQYTPVRERAVGREAVSTLRLIAAAERIYRMEIGSFYPSPNTTVSVPKDINDNLKVSVNANNWDYAISSTSSSDFSATANRVTGTGCKHSIDENGNEIPTASCP